MANYKDRLCVICGNSYTPTSPKQKVCISEECVAENRRRSDRKRYKDNQTIYTHTCKICGVEFTTTDTRKVYCGAVECKGSIKKVPTKRGGRAKKTLWEVREYFKSFGYELLSITYRNNKQVLKYRCSDGHVNGMSLANFITGKRCPDCYGNKKYTIDFIKQKFSEEDYTIVSNEYENGYIRLEYLCPKNHRNSMSWNNFRSGRRCPECQGIRRIDIGLIRKEFENSRYVLLSEEYIDNQTKLEYLCDKGHFNTMSWGNFNLGKRCPDCANNKVLTIEYVRSKFEEKGCTLLSTEYINSKSKLDYMCSAGHIGSATWDSFYTAEKDCPRCSKGGMSKVSQKWLDSLCIPNLKREYLIKKLGFRVDGFDPETNTVYEFLGDYWHGNPERFSSKKINLTIKKSFGQLYEETLDRINTLKVNGYKVVSVWEKDFKEVLE